MSEKSENKIEFLSEFLTQQMNHWMLFTVVLIVLGGASEYLAIRKPDLLMWVCCSVLPLLTFLIRWKVSGFFPFTLCNLMVLALTLVIPAENIVSRILCVACGLGYICYSYNLRLKSDSPFSSPFAPVLGIGSSVFGIIFLNQVASISWDSYFVFTLIICFALYLIIYYLNHFLGFLAVNASSTGSIPASEIFRSGMTLVTGFTLLGTIVLLLTMNLAWLKPVLDVLKQGLFIVLRFLVSLLPEEQEGETVIEQAVQGGNNSGGMMLPVEEPSLFWQIMEVICVVAFVCAALYVLIRVLFRIMRFLQERFQTGFRQKSRNIKESGTQDIREKCSLAGNAEASGREHRLFDFLNPGERVRRLYKKKLQGASIPLVKGEHKKLGLYTAREAEKSLGICGMAAVYEKVRYSGERIVQEDVRRMKEACKTYSNDIQ